MNQKNISQELVEFLSPMIKADLWDPLNPDETHGIGEDEVSVFLDNYCLYRGGETGLVDWLEYMLTEEYERRTGLYECSVTEMDDFIRDAIARTVFNPSCTMFKVDSMFATGADVLYADYRFYHVIETEEWLVMDLSEAQFDEEATGPDEGHMYGLMKEACEKGRKSVFETKTE